MQPLISAAKQAVGNINPKTLSEIRALRNPPEVIRDILEGVLRLMGIFDTTWVSMKRSTIAQCFCLKSTKCLKYVYILILSIDLKPK